MFFLQKKTKKKKNKTNSTTLSRRLTMHFSYTSSIAHHLKKNIHAQPQNCGKSLLKTTILKQRNNIKKLQILEALHIRNIQPKLNRINFETSANVLKCLKPQTLFIETNSKSKRYNNTNVHSYKVVMYIQK